MSFLPDLTISSFSYDLPDDRIAVYPAKPRDSAKLLVYQEGRIQDSVVSNLGAYLQESDCWVANNTQVIPARLWFQTEGGAIVQVFLLKSLGDDWTCWEALVGNRKRFKAESVLRSENAQGDFISVQWEDREQNRVILQSNRSSIHDALELFGRIPLPPYIKRSDSSSDKDDYQTLFAKHKGAVAAPTASLHFTPELRERLISHGLDELELTLHVGAGTFKPVSQENLREHDMHAETFVITQSLIEGLLRRGRGVIALGTTSMRVLESLYYLACRLKQDPHSSLFVASDDPYKPNWPPMSTREALDFLLQICQDRGGELKGETQIFIVPGFEFRLVDRLMTNFHQPQSTLLVLISAFIGHAWTEVYSHAMAHEYRFLSYGDASLLCREKKIEW